MLTRDELGKIAYRAHVKASGHSEDRTEGSIDLLWDLLEPRHKEPIMAAAEAVREAVILREMLVFLVVTEERMEAVRAEIREAGLGKTLAEMETLRGVIASMVRA